MLSVLINKKGLSSLFVWSFFSFALLRFFLLFIYLGPNRSGYSLLLASLYSLLSFLLYFVFKLRWRIKLNYMQYMICNMLFGILITAFSYSYYLVVMLPGDRFDLPFYVSLLLGNMLIGSILYLFTLIKRSAV
jgi:hypothetical protein